MNDRTKRGLDCIEAALLVGVTGDALLRATPWGINVLLWTGVLALAFIGLVARWHGALLKEEGRWLIFPLLFFAAAFAWRDSMVLKSLDFLALLLVLALLGWRARKKTIRLAGVMQYVLAIVVSGFNALFAFFPLALSDVRWKELRGTGWSRHVWAVVRGLLIALPLVFVFGLLFMAADAVFEGLVNKVFRVDLDKLFSHLFLILFLTWTVGGFLRGAFLGNEGSVFNNGPMISLGLAASAETTIKDGATAGAEKSVQQISRTLKMGIIEIGVVLGLLNLLFLSFVLVQIKYFFGGAALVQATTELTYAEYARRGFFELVTVATLVLPLLLGAHWLLRKDNPAHERIYRVLASLQIVLLFVIMASAIGRMRLYQSEYGQTELRVYTTAFMGWLALVFVWFTLTVLRGARERFACGALVTAFLMIGLLHVINPDALIVRTNMNLAQTEGRGFDASYASSLSADAVPALVYALPAASHYDQCVITASLLRRYDELGSADWRSWNLSRAGARAAIDNHIFGLREAACPQLMSPSTVSPAVPVEPQRSAPASEAEN